MYAFLVIFFAMVGNAQVFGLDVALCFIAPLLLFIFFKQQPVFSPHSTIVAGMFVALNGVMVAIAISGVDEFQSYYLWPIKAMLVALLVSRAEPGIQQTTFFAFFAFCTLLFLTSADNAGRSYGLFGPNMLYRFYGLLFALSLFVWLHSKHVLALLGIALSLLGIVTTGSAGGVVLLAIMLIYITNRAGKLLLAGFSFSILFALALPFLQNLVIVERLLLKLQISNLLNSTRFVNAVRILEDGFAFLGHKYSDFADIWQPLYFYPHNIFLELTSFFGAAGVFISLCLVYALYNAWVQIRDHTANAYTFVFISVFCGAFLSGELSDNYGCIGLAIASVIRPFSSYRPRVFA